MAAAPSSIGVIIDGNRRWARSRGLPQLEGHRRGIARVKDLALWAQEAGVKELTVYAFSTENWNRAPAEVRYLMRLFRMVLAKDLKTLARRGIRAQFVGERARFSKSLLAAMEAAVSAAPRKEAMILRIALSYGGRLEVVEAVNALLARGLPAADENDLRGAMWSAGMRDPDLIIRTGGEKRLSNFLLFQAAYSELFFTDTKWPDFSHAEFDAILEEFSRRERRHGK
jgi:undecaprenyl diphosphate synthase